VQTSHPTSVADSTPTALPRADRDFAGVIRDRVAKLRRLSDAQLQSAANDLRESLARDGFSQTAIPPGFALAYEAVRRTLGIELYDVQLIGSHALVRNAIAEMQTGEGKTLTAVPAAVTRGLAGQGVHVANPNSYLAQRDLEQLQPAFELLGLSAGMLPERVDSSQKRVAYECDVTYGTGYEFGFDYLRDHLALRGEARHSLGQSMVDTLQRRVAPGHDTCQRSLTFSIVDEADNVLVDDASSPLVLAQSSHEVAPDADAVCIARYVATLLQPVVHYRLLGPQNIELTDAGRVRVHHEDISIPVRQLIRPWTTYVEQALRAELQFRRDIHYVVAESEIQIVDGSTGRIFSDRTWQGGLHQAVEAKERLSISAENATLAQITRQRFYRLYSHLSGMTGTAGSCIRELRSVYQLEVLTIPPRLPSRRRIMPMRFFSTMESKWRAIREQVAEFQNRHRPVLIGTRSIAESEQLADLLTSANIEFQLLNGRQDAEEAAVITAAGQPGRVTIATNLAGRGTDIKLPKSVCDTGGLHVIVSECQESARVDRQLVGRCARQGQPGSAQTFVSADDWLLLNHGQWLTSVLRRDADAQGEVQWNLESRVRRIQQAAERVQYAARAALFRRDLAQS